MTEKADLERRRKWSEESIESFQYRSHSSFSPVLSRLWLDRDVSVALIIIIIIVPLLVLVFAFVLRLLLLVLCLVLLLLLHRLSACISQTYGFVALIETE